MILTERGRIDADRAAARDGMSGAGNGVHGAGSGTQDGHDASGAVGEQDAVGEQGDEGDPGHTGGVAGADGTATVPHGSGVPPGRQGLPGGGDGKYGPPPEDIPSGEDDDIVARQIREAALNEPDPELREKLWDEYRRYKGLK